MEYNPSAILLALVTVAAVFLILSALIMALWNSSVMKAFSPGAIQKINYSTAMGLTVFIMLVMPGGVYLVR